MKNNIIQNSLFDINGKRAIVTGSAQGLGNGIAEGLLKSGATVVLFDLQDNVEGVVAAYREQGFDAHAVVVDLGDDAKREDAFNKAIDIMGGVDILVNSAGITRRHRADEFPLEDFDLIYNVNLRAVFALSQLAANEMIKQRKGKIINIASMNSFFGGKNNAGYSSMKGGIALLTKSMASDLAQFGLNINALAPGYMRTPLNEALLKDEKRLAEISERIPEGRWGSPMDMIGPAIFLASDASNYLNGAVIPVDGGYMTR